MSEKRKSIEIEDNDSKSKRLRSDVENFDLNNDSLSNCPLPLSTSTPAKPLPSLKPTIDPNNNVEELVVEELVVEELVVEPTISTDNFDQNSEDNHDDSDSTSNLEETLQQISELRKQILSTTLKESDNKDHLLPSHRKSTFNENDLNMINKKRSNFVSLIEEAMRDSTLFYESEIDKINKFKSLTIDRQTLLMLLFLKRDKWIYVESVNFQESYKSEMIKEMVANDFLLNHNHLQNLEEALYLLEQSKLIEIAKKYKVSIEHKGKTIRKLLVQTKLRTVDGRSLSDLMLADTKKFFDSNECIRLCPKMRSIFLKAMLLQFEPPAVLHDLNSYYTNLILNVRSGDYCGKNYAKYSINKTIEIYNNASDLDYFTNACLTELSLNENRFCDTKCLLALLNTYEDYIKSNYLQDLSLPKFLIRFTGGHKLVKCLEIATNLVQNQIIKEELYNFVKQQQNFGLWSEEQKIDDDLVIAHKTVLFKDEKEKRKDKVKLLERAAANLYPNGTTNKHLCRSIFISLFYHEIFASNINDVFRYRMQKYPLDLVYGQDFYNNRKEMIEKRFEEINKLKITQIRDLIKKQHSNLPMLKSYTHLNQSDYDLCKDLICLMKKSKFVQVLHYLSQNFPTKDSTLSLIKIDLDESFVKFIEVKERDTTLDNDRIRWVNFLRSIDVAVEVCDFKIKFD